MLKIAVIDGQGGGIGKTIISQLKQEEIPLEIIAIGTNALATSAMIKAGADVGATGENAVIYNSSKVDIIAGPMGIILANSMYGEVTPQMAFAITQSTANKVIIPVSKCGVYIAGMTEKNLMQYIDEAVKYIKNICK